MVKAVVADEVRIKAFEDGVASSGVLRSQVGLVVGKLSASSDRALVYSLLPTPPTDAGEPACSLRAAAPSAGKAKSKGGKGGAGASSDAPPTLQFDVDWVAEHARQASRMLLGGMSVIGIYIWSSEGSFKATPSAVLSQVIRVVSQSVPWYGSDFDERLLLHLSYSPRRWACRICEMASGSLRPCDFKYSKLLASLQTFRCTYNFETRLTVVQAEPFKKVISKAISHLTKEVQNAKALIDGDLFSDDMTITSEGPHEVDLLVPFKNNLPAGVSAYTKECSLEGVAGLLLFAGSVSALAYLGPKESISEAISDLKQTNSILCCLSTHPTRIKVDIIASLRSRLDIILDEADDDSTTNDMENSASQKVTQVNFHELREPYSFSFPRRILIPWLAGSYICDYLQQSETTKDAMERCKEVISLETEVENSILEPETASSTVTLESFWDVVPGASSRARAGPSLKDVRPEQATGSGRTQGNSFSILAALFVLLVALLVGFMFAFPAKSKT
uniref:Protein odr-4-like protein n=1 Tax=Aegilops tauschii TaxID=37682 RepID=M8C8X0_AEGTA